jgi:uncharacterized protein
VIPLIEANRERLAVLCRRYRVERMFVFGSAASGTFRPGTSDLDFIVRLADRSAAIDYAHRFLDLAEELETLFGLRVDLLTEESVANPYLRSSIDATKQLVYEQ